CSLYAPQPQRDRDIGAVYSLFLCSPSLGHLSADRGDSPEKLDVDFDLSAGYSACRRTLSDGGQSHEDGSSGGCPPGTADPRYNPHKSEKDPADYQYHP